MNGTEEVKGKVLWEEKPVLAEMLFKGWESIRTVSKGAGRGGKPSPIIVLGKPNSEPYIRLSDTIPAVLLSRLG